MVVQADVAKEMAIAMCLEGEAHSVWRQAGCACVRKKAFIASDVTDRDRETWGGMGLGEGREVASFLFFFFCTCSIGNACEPSAWG